MQRSGGVVILMKDQQLEWIIGSDSLEVSPLPPYSEMVVRFLDALSKDLRKIGTERGYPDLVSLGFWCRKGNILQLKNQVGDISCRLGRGLVFHITPSNVPINFAFSYFFGLLAGNANLVRVPSKQYPQVDIICQLIAKQLEAPEYEAIRVGTAFVRYGHDKAITDSFSQRADSRIIWGGDTAIQEIRQSPMKAQGTEIVFADRYSVGVLDSAAVLQASPEALSRLAKQFYNDTYLMDQNACSTPHTIFWLGEQTEEAKRIFWNAVWKEAKAYALEPIKVMDKYTDLCRVCMQHPEVIKTVQKYENYLYTIELTKLPQDITGLRGRFGMFYQMDLAELQQLAPYMTSRLQTVLYYGVDKQQILEVVLQNHCQGVDRIVPFGSALDMNVYWDGYDIIGQLSRRLQCV